MIKIPLNLVRDIINLDFACALKKNKKSPKRMFSPCEEWQEAACETGEGNVQSKENHFHFLMRRRGSKQKDAENEHCSLNRERHNYIFFSPVLATSSCKQCQPVNILCVEFSCVHRNYFSLSLFIVGSRASYLHQGTGVC